MSQNSSEAGDLDGGTGDSTSSAIVSPKKARRMARVNITAGNDLIILTGVLGTNPFEDGERWKDVAYYVSSMVPKRFSARNVKDRVDYLLKMFPIKYTSLKRKTGTEEEYFKRNQLLQKAKKLKDSFSKKKATCTMSREEFQTVRVASTAALMPGSQRVHNSPAPLLGLPTNNPESVDDEAYKKEAPTDNSSENIPSTAVTEEAEQMKHTPETILTRKDSLEPLSSKIQKISQGPQACGTSEILDDTSNYAAPTPRDDSYDYFGKYISSMLRSIGPPTAMRLQEQITHLVTEAMCPPQ